MTTANITASGTASTTANNIASALNNASISAAAVTVSASNNRTYDITFSGASVVGANLNLVTITSNAVTPSLTITPQPLADGISVSGTLAAVTVTEGIGNAVQRLNVGGAAGGKIRLVLMGPPAAN